MKYISEEQVKEVIRTSDIIDVVRRAHADCSNGLIEYTDRVTMFVHNDDHTAIWLPAIMRNRPYFGAKYATGFPSNIQKGLPTVVSQISIYSSDTGELLSIVSANYITAIKTGASAAVATDIMARKDASTLGIIGTGIQAFTQVLAIQEVRDIKELIIFDMSEERMDAFAEMIRKEQKYPFEITKAKSADDCVSRSDIISTCTPSLTPVFNGESLKKGTHVNGIGCYTPQMQELDEITVTNADRISTEHVSEMWKVAGDILIPYEKSLITKDKVVGSLGDILNEKACGRGSDDEITLYESNGSGVLDLAVAVSIYEKFKDK